MLTRVCSGVCLSAWLFAAFACSASSGPSVAGAGGSQFGGKGGASGSGGAGGSSTGGTAGTGGSVIITGGSAGSGGDDAAGGASGSGGSGATDAAIIDGGGCSVDGSAGSGGSGGGTTGPEQCGNGLDDDNNGFVDEGCACTLGAKQPCYDGPPWLSGVGACTKGEQACEGTAEFHGWGPCLGSTPPSVEICEGASDENCNGLVDESCQCCTGETRPCGPTVGICTPGSQTCVNGVWGACEGVTVPGQEICDNGLDDNCDGVSDEGCKLDVPVNIDGDCVRASCPPQAPYAIGCTVTFSGDDPRGCVANTLNDSIVYFQEGDKCGAGHVSGTLFCSSQPSSTPLNDQNCPINKSTKYYPPARSGCPAT
jgi:hypothetical protein